MSTGTDQTRSRSRFRTLFIRISLICVLVIGLASAYFYSADDHHDTSTAQAKQARQPVTPELGLIAERRGAEVLLSWNHEAAAFAGATEGVLIIRAENSIQQIVLTPDRLRSGSILYSPTGDEIDIGLQVRSAGHAVADSAVVIPPATPDATQALRSAVTTAQSSEHPVRDNAQGLSVPTSSSVVKSESRLRLVGQGPAVMLARGLSGAAELHENPSSLERLIRDGSLFAVAVGTAVAARQMESRQVEVRILEGINAGQEGWIDISQLTTK